jgi:hypothetical protein
MSTRKKSPLRVPVTHGMKDVYAMDMRLAYQAAISGKFNVVAFSRLAAALSVIRSALERNQTSIPGAIETMDAAVSTLQNIRTRGDATTVWEILEDELPIVHAGINMAEQSMGTLDVVLLEQTAAMLLEQLYGEQKTPA